MGRGRQRPGTLNTESEHVGRIISRSKTHHRESLVTRFAPLRPSLQHPTVLVKRVEQREHSGAVGLGGGVRKVGVVGTYFFSTHAIRTSEAGSGTFF